MMLIERQAPSHWYLRNGQPFHEVEKKDGTGKRPVTLADARKVLALPSVTNVLGIIAKPGLESWKVEQGIMAALTLPRQADEPLDAFARRVVADMSAQVEKAAEFGTAIHGACELYAAEKVLPEDPALAPFLEGWRAWFDTQVERVECLERVVVSGALGYAGRVDMIAKLRGIGWAVVDFKTQKVRRGPRGEGRPAFYESWPLQLAAYRQAWLETSGKEVAALASVVIDSSAPGPVHVRVWEEPVEQFELFCLALELWKAVKGYDPLREIPVCPRPELN